LEDRHNSRLFARLPLFLLDLHAESAHNHSAATIFQELSDLIAAIVFLDHQGRATNGKIFRVGHN